MTDLYELLDPGLADEIQRLTSLSYETRENRKAILGAYDAADETDLLDRIRNGTVDEHPGYEHYLAARILDDTREAARALIALRLKERHT